LIGDAEHHLFTRMKFWRDALDLAHPTMPTRKNPEEEVNFYQRLSADLDQCLLTGSNSRVRNPLCQRIINEARRQLGYSPSTCSVDIYRPLLRRYKKWKQGRTPPENMSAL
jgi:hypothetical protein